MTRLHRLTLLITFALALGIRLYDLTDPPFDFHATRQFRSAVIARGIYYAGLENVGSQQRELAMALWKSEPQLEPPIIEWLTAFTYHLPGGEALWKARLLSSLFWVLGGLALYAMAKEITSHYTALICTLVYLFLPYGVIASRSFQPDPMMVMWTVFALWELFQWHKTRTWRNATLAGVFAGVAILSKAVALFPIGGVATALVFFDRDWKSTLRNGQAWAVSLLAVTPGAAYYIYGIFIAGFLQGQAKQSFIPSLWLDPVYYLRWANLVINTVGFSILLISLVGIFLWKRKTDTVFSTGLWVGYGLYGMAFPYHIMTHDYYQLPLIPIVALSLAPAVELVVEQLAHHRSRLLPIAMTVFVGGGVLFQMWNARVDLARKNYSSDAQEWSRFQTIIPPDLTVIALVQAYGYPLKYYGWVEAELWANTSDLNLRELAGQSKEQIEQNRWSKLDGMDLFLVTNFNEFNLQPDLQEFLKTTYKVYGEGDGYVIFDLK
jgi:4-amino-4-deoxy-L-arabinose transferase-like glycosyltransferase